MTTMLSRLGRTTGFACVLMASLTLCGGAWGAAKRGLSVEIRASEAQGAPSAGQVELYAESHALVIGNDNYTEAGWARLSNAVSDAKMVAAALERQGFEVTLKTDLDSDALQETLKDFFIQKGRNPGARLFVWFAGHGHTLDGEGYLIPVDGKTPRDEIAFLERAISLRDFGKFARYAKSKHVLAVFDSCFAGTVFTVARSTPPPAITRITTEPVRQFLSSGDAGQEVSDDGTFARLFVESLDGKNRADANGDGYLTGSEIGAYLTYQVSNISSNQQTPRYGKLRSADLSTGDFVFRLASLTPEKGMAPSSDASSQSPGIDKEVVFWRAIENSNDKAQYEAYLQQYPTGTFAPLARARIEGLTQKSPPAAPGDQIAELDERRWVDADQLSVRAGPGTKHERIGSLARGTPVVVTGKAQESDWLRVSLADGKTGFVSGKYLATEEPKRSASAPPSRAGEPVRRRPTGNVEVINASDVPIDPSTEQLLVDVVNRSFGTHDRARIERATVRLTSIAIRQESNPDYVGAKLAEGVFGIFLGKIASNVPQTLAIYNATATVTVSFKDGGGWSDSSSIQYKGDGAADKVRTLAQVLMQATTKATERVAIRMAGGTPPLASSGLSPVIVPQGSSDGGPRDPNVVGAPPSNYR